MTERRRGERPGRSNVSVLPGGSTESAARPAVGDGELRVVVTYLEMTAPPPPRAASRRLERLAIMRAERPTPSFYRYLYETVGDPWRWYERRLLGDDALAAIVHDPLVEIYVAYVAGTPAGYVELDRRVDAEVELAYFGLVPEFVGRGLGGWLLEWAVGVAWRPEPPPSRVWVNTCDLDHPAALGVYQRAGFVPYAQETKVVPDPARPGAMPPGREFRGTL